MHGVDYERRLAAERETFAQQVDLHGSLPESAHRWSARHMLPKLNALGVSGIDHLITGEIASRAAGLDRDAVVLSLGSGNGDQELGWLRTLADEGVHNVRVRLLEINTDMQERAAKAADSLGLADRVEPVVADFNSWVADAQHDVVVGYQVLHHVLDLEHLYGQIRDSLTRDGVLVVHDMIGRNGHRRWPEALEVVERIWATLPAELRRNAITGAVDEVYADVDCAVDGFEGIRAQDVLPVLLHYLHPGFFLALGNVIDPFIDRIYGHNFDMADPAHRARIDQLGTLDDTLIDLGIVTPTRLTALFHPTPQPLRVHGERTPSRSIRNTEVLDPAGRVSFDPRGSDPGGLVRGAGVAAGRMNGVFHDAWAGRTVRFPVLTTADVASIELRTYVPEWMPYTGQVTVSLDGTPVGSIEVGPELTERSLPVRVPAHRTAELALSADWAVNPSDSGLGDDRRNLAYVLVGITLREI
ncbi:SAM-dependent methyltransferase [Prauserella endophytica]|uniref:Methyltransferase domain-containing protein n=1 Tax=Prauserella endophytica TaxID=1592324 RepID=A0ABY2SFD4_9PSEU|nr:methyltransferase domain-containing protein [Prauserella endophytica]TKG73769.1 methyltransferase domain-containing protein [Prauserella endophytica]